MDPRNRIAVILFAAALAHFGAMLITLWYLPTGLMYEMSPVGRWIFSQPLWVPFAGWAGFWAFVIVLFSWSWSLIEKRSPQNLCYVRALATLMLLAMLFDFANDIHVAHLIQPFV